MKVEWAGEGMPDSLYSAVFFAGLADLDLD